PAGPNATARCSSGRPRTRRCTPATGSSGGSGPGRRSPAPAPGPGPRPADRGRPRARLPYAAPRADHHAPGPGRAPAPAGRGAAGTRSLARGLGDLVAAAAGGADDPGRTTGAADRGVERQPHPGPALAGPGLPAHRPAAGAGTGAAGA